MTIVEALGMALVRLETEHAVLARALQEEQQRSAELARLLEEMKRGPNQGLG